METSIEISWTNGFDGFTPITGALVSYTNEINPTVDQSIVMPNPVGYTITGLNPFTEYNVSVALTNVVENSDSIGVTARTLSLGKCVYVHIEQKKSLALALSELMWLCCFWLSDI